MKLDAWLRQDHPLADRLRLVERLSQALNAVHDRGEVLAALAPARVEVGNDLQCDLSAAGRGSPEPGYAAPERLEGKPPSPEADIYSAGAIAWEVLVGRPCGELPAPLSDVAPDLPRELANAIQGCLERSPQWRPKDLTYLAQLAAAQQKAGRPETAPTPGRASPPRGQRPRRAHSATAAVPEPLAPRDRGGGGARPRRRRLLVDPGPGAGRASSRRRASAREGGADAGGRAVTRRDAGGASLGNAVVAGRHAPATATPGPTPAPRGAGADAPRRRRRPRPPPRRRPRPPPRRRPRPPPADADPDAPRHADARAGRRPRAPGVEPPSAPLEPVVLTALSPLTVRRPGKALLDLRGTGLRPDLRARVLPLREVPRGITVARQKWVSANLVTVLLELDEGVTPGAYAIVLEDPAGGPVKPLQFTVTK